MGGGHIIMGSSPLGGMRVYFINGGDDRLGRRRRARMVRILTAANVTFVRVPAVMHPLTGGGSNFTDEALSMALPRQFCQLQRKLGRCPPSEPLCCTAQWMVPGGIDFQSKLPCWYGSSACKLIRPGVVCEHTHVYSKNWPKNVEYTTSSCSGMIGQQLSFERALSTIASDRAAGIVGAKAGVEFAVICEDDAELTQGWRRRYNAFLENAPLNKWHLARLHGTDNGLQTFGNLATLLHVDNASAVLNFLRARGHAHGMCMACACTWHAQLPEGAGHPCTRRGRSQMLTSSSCMECCSACSASPSTRDRPSLSRATSGAPR